MKSMSSSRLFLLTFKLGEDLAELDQLLKEQETEVHLFLTQYLKRFDKLPAGQKWSKVLMFL